MANFPSNFDERPNIRPPKLEHIPRNEKMEVIQKILTQSGYIHQGRGTLHFKNSASDIHHIIREFDQLLSQYRAMRGDQPSSPNRQDFGRPQPELMQTQTETRRTEPAAPEQRRPEAPSQEARRAEPEPRQLGPEARPASAASPPQEQAIPEGAVPKDGEKLTAQFAQPQGGGPNQPREAHASSLMPPPSAPKDSSDASPPLSPKRPDIGSKSISANIGDVPILSTKGSQDAASPLTGFSKEQLSDIFQQVALSVLLFKSDGGQESGPASTSFLQSISNMQQCAGLSRELTTLMTQIQQAISQGKSIPPEQREKMISLLDTMFKQLAEMEKQLPQGQAKPATVTGNEVLADPLLNAALIAKVQSDDLLDKMQRQLESKFDKFANQTPLKSKQAEGAGQPPSAASASQKKEQAPQLKSELLASSQSGPSISPSAEKTSAASISPLPLSGAPGQLGLEKSSQQATQLIQSSADLLALAAKLQKKELTAPINIALIYPLDRQRSSENVAGVKSGSKQSREGQKGEAPMGGGEKVQEMVLIPAGPALARISSQKDNIDQASTIELPDFLISVYAVTNAQFADWLNEMYSENNIQLTEKGIVLNKQGRVLCKTHWAAPTSQIEAVASKERLTFKPLKSTEQHPVVQVSWLGAEDYCATYNFKLPSEAEWEKAAGMPSGAVSEPLSYYTYGCGKNEIDLSLANFRDELQEYKDNRTTPVGFYNGDTVFIKQGRSYQSKNASSPFGCYDMSGNVHEWTSDGIGEHRVAKGGSYNSPPEELVITARKLLDLHTCYADTGFRVALDLT